MSGKKTAVSLAWTLVKIAVLILIVVVVYKLSFAAYDFGFRVFADDAIDREPGIEKTVTIVEGKSVKEIGEILEAKGLIRDATLFVFQEKFSDYKGELKPGVYELTTAMTPFEMMQIMSAEREETDTQESFDSSQEPEVEKNKIEAKGNERRKEWEL